MWKWRKKRTWSTSFKSLIIINKAIQSFSDWMALFELFYSLIFMNPFIYPQTFSAISLTSFNFAHCSSSVSLLPISQEAKPHCGLKQSLSREIYLAASYILLITSFLSSSLVTWLWLSLKLPFCQQIPLQAAQMSLNVRHHIQEEVRQHFLLQIHSLPQGRSAAWEECWMIIASANVGCDY